MPDKWPLANGNWSNAANWNGGTKPVAGDDVYADGRTVTVDENVTVASIRGTQRSGGTAGGGFNLNTGINVTADIYGGTAGFASTLNVPNTGTNIITGNVVGGVGTTTHGILIPATSSANVTVNGNCTGGSLSASTPDAVSFAGTGTLTINGNCTGGSTNGGHGLELSGSGVANVFGNVLGGPGGENGGILVGGTGSLNLVGDVYPTPANNGYGIAFTGSGSHTITGNVFGNQVNSSAAVGIRCNAGTYSLTVNGTITGGDFAAATFGLRLSGNGTVTINGTCQGRVSSAVDVNSAGTCIINGTAVGSNNNSTAPGASNTSTGGTLRVKRAKGNGFGNGSSGLSAAVGVSGNNTSTTEVEEFEFGDLGMVPVSGQVALRDVTTNVMLGYRVGLSKKTLVDPATAGDYPANSNVRLGTVFNFANNTGTLAVPNPNQVAVGVATDSTVGTAVLTAATLRAAMGLASANLDTQLNGISTKTNQLTFTVANQVDSNSLTGGLTQAQVRSAVGLASANLDTQLAGIATDIDNITVDNAAIAEAVETQLSDDFQNVIDALGNITVDNVAIAEAVETQLADEFTTIENAIENSLNDEAVAQLVFQSIVGSGVARYSIPQVTGTIEAVKYADFDLSISASTASDSILYLSIGCENHTSPNLQADSVAGLTILNSLTDFDPADVTVIRTSPTAVTVWISARVLSKLSAADYVIALTEITSDAKTKLRFEKFFSLRSGAGRVIG